MGKHTEQKLPGNRRMIDGQVHVWDIYENAWVSLEYWEWVHQSPTAKQEAASKKKHSAVQLCEWRLMCPMPATTERSHPIIGQVPVCHQCAAAVDASRGK